MAARRLASRKKISFMPVVPIEQRVLEVSKIVPLKFADQMYEEIIAAIVNGKLPEGEKLPAETELAASFGVSRPVVREALSRLRADGVIVSRRGSGSYVQRKPSRQFLSLAPIGGIADLMRCFEFRIALEGEAAALAAIRRTDKDLAEISAALKDLDDAITHNRVGTHADMRFHNAIAAASKNKLFTMTLQTLSDVIFQGVSVARKLTLKASTKRLLTVQTEHCRIFEAIRNGDANGVRKVVRQHIENARARVLSDTVEPNPD